MTALLPACPLPAPHHTTPQGSGATIDPAWLSSNNWQATAQAIDQAVAGV